MTNDPVKTVIWVNYTKEELLEFPEDVIDEIGYILYRVQVNTTHAIAFIDKREVHR